MKTQNYANHVRWYPLVHFVIVPLLLIALIYQSVRLYQDPSFDRLMMLVLTITLMLINLAARLQALKAQDRVIRLEENIRFGRLLGVKQQAAAADLSLSQIIALRFASDEELPTLIDAVGESRLKTSKEIKQAIQSWRADHLRV